MKSGSKSTAHEKRRDLIWRLTGEVTVEQKRRHDLKNGDERIKGRKECEGERWVYGGARSLALPPTQEGWAAALPEVQTAARHCPSDGASYCC